jgi:hypothetical protein
MPIPVLTSLDFGGLRRAINLPNAVGDQEPATLAQLKSAIEGLAQKDNVRVATQSNTGIAAPGATIDGITMVANDRVLVKAQTTQTENGIYIWNGAATPMTRSLDANTFDELESALVPVDEGTNAGQTWRQTAVNGVIGTNNVLWVVFGTSSPAATTASAGIVRLATQGETDTGTDPTIAVTPATLASSAYASKKFGPTTFGDGSATSYVFTHNLNSRAVNVDVYQTAGNFTNVLCEVQRTSLNSVTLLFDAGSAPAANALTAMITT